MLSTFHKLLHKLQRDVWRRNGGTLPQMVVTGDLFQELYGFKGVDYRYLTLADRGAFPHNTVCPGLSAPPGARPWKRLRLLTSYRLTANIAEFVNDVMLQKARMKAVKPRGEPVDYHVGNTWVAAEKVAKELIVRLNRGAQDGSLLPGDIFVLAPSLKASKLHEDGIAKMRPLQLFENILQAGKVPIYLPSDGEELQGDSIAGKVLHSLGTN